MLVSSSNLVASVGLTVLLPAFIVSPTPAVTEVTVPALLVHPELLLKMEKKSLELKQLVVRF